MGWPLVVTTMTVSPAWNTSLPRGMMVRHLWVMQAINISGLS